jgi:hypothetical protein
MEVLAREAAVEGAGRGAATFGVFSTNRVAGLRGRVLPKLPTILSK